MMAFTSGESFVPDLNCVKWIVEKRILLEDLEIYKIAQNLGEDIWIIVRTWGFFERDVIGRQLIKAADSIAANIAEGYGRYYFKERRMFCFYARGSIFETKTWLYKSYQRELIKKEKFDFILEALKNLHFMLNTFIKSISHSAGKS